LCGIGKEISLIVIVGIKMAVFPQNIKTKLTRLNVLEKIIAINGLIFIFVVVSSLVQGLPTGYSLGWLELPSDLGVFILNHSSIVTYYFAHFDFLHILFIMLWLYVIG